MLKMLSYYSTEYRYNNKNQVDMKHLLELFC